METTSPLLQQSLLLIWNNRNAAERLTIMAGVYAPDVQFFESNDAAPFVGFEAINALIDKLQSGWPASFAFLLKEPVKINHTIQYASWTLGAPGEPPAATGFDIAITEAGKITAFYLFLGV